MNKILYCLAVSVVLLFGSISCSAEDELVIDAVLAVVDGEPITLSDLESYSAQDFPNKITELKENTAAKEALELLIEKQVLENEARDRKISANETEVERYVNEIAARNNLSIEEFAVALTEQGSSLHDFKQKTYLEILRTKLATTILNKDVAVAEDEAKKIVSETAQPEAATEKNVKVKLAQIFISAEKNSTKEQTDKLNKIKEELAGGKSFTALASKFSDARDKASGGILPLINENDLSKEILAAIAELQEGEVSDPQHGADGIRIFQLIKRYLESEVEKSLVDQATEELRAQKIESTLQKFFISDIYERHTIDRKI